MKYIIVEDGMCYKTDTLSENVIRDCKHGYISIIDIKTLKQFTPFGYFGEYGWIEIDIREMEEVQK